MHKKAIKIVEKSFYHSEDVTGIAKALLGKIVATEFEGVKTAGIIVETEAYRGLDDRACHAYGNKLTSRTATMFKDGGKAYVYKCYGIHDMLNVVTGPVGIANAVLIRAIQPMEGLDVMCARRGVGFNNYLLTGGPGKVCQALGISTYLDGISLWEEGSPVRLFDGVKFSDSSVKAGPRVGMSEKTLECRNWNWRFFIDGNQWVSRPLEVKYHLKGEK